MKKTWTALCMVFVMLFALTGCGSSTKVVDFVTNNVNGKNSSEKTKTNKTETEAGTKVIAAKDIKVGVLYIGSASDTSGYTYAHEQGIKTMANNLGLTSKQIVRKENISDDNMKEKNKAIQECIDAGCNIIFGTSFGEMQELSEFAEKYPDIYFAHGSGYMSNGKNFTNYFGRIYQARYLSGIAAGLKTQSNKIGYVAAQDNTNAEVTGGIDAFAMGVESVNTNATIYVKVTHSWYDPAEEKAAAKALLSQGCDVLAQHCDTTAPQEEAQKKGVWGIGYNSDMSKETPDSCLTSVIWNWSAYYTSAVQSIMDGTWTGENYYGGMAEGLIQITDLASFAKEGTQEKVDEATTAILSGENNVFDGVLETNTGKKIGAANSTLDDATITGNINWYYKNVVIVK